MITPWRFVGFFCLLLAGVMASPLVHPGYSQDPTPQPYPKDDFITERLFVRGMTKAFLNEHDRALEFFLETIKYAPREAPLYSAASTSYEALGDLSAAVLYAREAVRLDGGQVLYHLQLARLLNRKGDFTEALQAYRTLADRFPKHQEGLNELAQLQTQMGQSREALATYDRLVALGTDLEQVHRQRLHLFFQLGDPEGTRQALEALIDLDPYDPAPWRLLGQLHLQRLRHQEALDAFEQAYQVDPNDFETVMALANLYRQMGRDEEADDLLIPDAPAEVLSAEELVTRARPFYERSQEDPAAAETARQLLQRALEREANHPEGLFMMGGLLFRSGAFGEAAGLLERSVNLDPRNLEGWHLATLAYYQAGDLAACVRIAEEGLMLFPGQIPLVRSSAFGHLALHHDATAQALFEELEALYDESKTASKQDLAALWAGYGVLSSRKKDFTAADALFKKALEQDPKHPFALSQYAFSLAERGLDLDRAQGMAEQALASSPGDGTMMDTLAWVFFKQKKYAEALEWLEKALATGLETVTLLDHYGDTLARLGSWEAARRAWRRALDRSPGNTELLNKLEQVQY